jgi:hypothetical protein
MAIYVSHPRQTQDGSPHSISSAGDGSSVVYQGMRWSGAGGSAVHAHITAARDSSAPMRSGRLSLDCVKGPATQPLHSSARKRVFGCTCEAACLQKYLALQLLTAALECALSRTLEGAASEGPEEARLGLF